MGAALARVTSAIPRATWVLNVFSCPESTSGVRLAMPRAFIIVAVT